MASIIERLTEGVVNRDMRAESNALLTKWERTGLLEGLNHDRQKASMARLLENQAKELLRESSSMSAGDVEGFAAVAFPIVRRVFAGLIANDLVSVQPMSLPSGLIFFLDFTFASELGASSTQDRRFGNIQDKSIYGSDEVASQITGGVDLLDARKGDFGGPRTVGARGYAYGSPSGSAVLSASASDFAPAGWQIGSETDAQKKLVQYDPDVMALADESTNYFVLELAIPRASAQFASGQWGQMDFNNLSAIDVPDITDIDDVTDGVSACTTSNTSHLRRLTQATADLVKLYFVTTNDTTSVVDGTGTSANLNLEFPIDDNFAASNAIGSVVGTTEWGLEGNELIPEIDIKVDSIAVTAQTKKLKAKWTPELGQDLNAYHNLDAETELTSILSEQIALEIDREILADLVTGATASTYYWSRSPGLFVNRETGAELGASAAAPDFTGTVSEWYETLVETINDVSAQIHRKTLRGGANFIVCGPEVANVLEFTAGFRASVTADDETGSIGAVNVGSLSKKFDVIVDPYFLRNVVLVGRRGNSFLESGYVYAPYVPLQTTPTIFGPEDFVPRKGVMTRYAKKMVRPDMYGLVIVRGLLGESGAS